MEEDSRMEWDERMEEWKILTGKCTEKRILGRPSVDKRTISEDF